MRLGIISDPHGNLVSLEKVLGKLDGFGVDEIVCLGDVVGYFPDGRQCLDILRAANCRLLQGNHEAMLTQQHELDPLRDEAYGLAAQRKLFDDGEVAFLSQLISSYSAEIDGFRILCVHGTPWDSLHGYLYPTDICPEDKSLGVDMIFMGHTHRQHEFQTTLYKAVNVGSCGLPRDMGSLPGFCVFDTETGQVELLRVRVPASLVLEKYPDVHPSVRDCLGRNETAPSGWREA